MINSVHTHTRAPAHAHTPTAHLQGVLAEGRLEAEGGPRPLPVNQAVAQNDLIKLGPWRSPLHKRYGVRNIPDDQLCGAVNPFRKTPERQRNNLSE